MGETARSATLVGAAANSSSSGGASVLAPLPVTTPSSAATEMMIRSNNSVPVKVTHVSPPIGQNEKRARVVRYALLQTCCGLD